MLLLTLLQLWGDESLRLQDVVGQAATEFGRLRIADPGVFDEGTYGTAPLAVLLLWRCHLRR